MVTEFIIHCNRLCTALKLATVATPTSNGFRYQDCSHVRTHDSHGDGRPNRQSQCVLHKPLLQADHCEWHCDRGGLTVGILVDDVLETLTCASLDILGKVISTCDTFFLFSCCVPLLKQVTWDLLKDEQLQWMNNPPKNPNDLQFLIKNIIFVLYIWWSIKGTQNCSFLVPLYQGKDTKARTFGGFKKRKHECYQIWIIKHFSASLSCTQCGHLNGRVKQPYVYIYAKRKKEKRKKPHEITTS